jgi:hypothetical protein
MAFESSYLKEGSRKVPFYDGTHYLINGELRQWTGPKVTVHSPIYQQGKSNESIVIGSYPSHTEKEVCVERMLFIGC